MKNKTVFTQWSFVLITLILGYIGFTFLYDIEIGLSLEKAKILVEEQDTKEVLIGLRDWKYITGVISGLSVIGYCISILSRIDALEMPNWRACIVTLFMFAVAMAIDISILYFLIRITMYWHPAWTLLGVAYLIICGITVCNESDHRSDASMSGLGLAYSIHIYLYEYVSYVQGIESFRTNVKDYLKLSKY